MKTDATPRAWQVSFDEVLGSQRLPGQADIRRACVNPQPIRLFFADFLDGNLSKLARTYIKRFHEGRKETQKKNGYIAASPLPESQTRKQWEHALTIDQADIARLFMDEPFVRATAAVIQAGITAFYTEVEDHLKTARRDGLRNRNDIVTIGIYVHGVWDDLLPHLAHSYATHTDDDNAFRGAFRLAHDNHAFQSYDGEKKMICPARFMLKHLLNTDYVRQPDGGLAPGKYAQDGALPAYVYNTLKKESSPSPEPSTM